ncbi:CDP-alcohol phosphatidyltransferase family protein [Nocardiopsis sp. N85]|uniref:CDP-alcohol phosphatidyltransferase family protein n=1 Tax=Nocardiopsis sp. N85 TaxID=3029400 RepID=UPI00237F7694|nr:CDP-alcohol phosphatidyltransferase family protein [Nocardiopsis sp. N85]MDE3724201.1 CDP-alcohol phosphatidyltransferase family protein [Nocardiopsis sp. N85]
MSDGPAPARHAAPSTGATAARPARPRARRVLAGAATAQAAVAVAVAVTVGLGPAGWATLVLVAATGAATLAWAAARTGHRFGPADLVTLARSTLIVAVTALVVDGGPAWAVVALASLALALDLVDGPVARRTGTSSRFGARFDMEADAFLLLVLSVCAAPLLGPWTIAIGAMRYLFAAAVWWAPWMGGPLPPGRARKLVAAVQGVALVAGVAPVVPPSLGTAVVAGALALLFWSFGRDVVTLWRSRADGPTTRPAGSAPT